MASDELKEIRKAMTREAIREHQMARTGGTQTDLFTCGKCRKKNCTYTQASGCHILSPCLGAFTLSLEPTAVTALAGWELCSHAWTQARAEAQVWISPALSGPSFPRPPSLVSSVSGGGPTCSGVQKLEGCPAQQEA